MREVKLTQGKVALVDDEVFTLVSELTWQAHFSKGKWYAWNSWRRNKKYGKTWMHRFILSAPIDVEVDHVNGDGLDNRRGNLRLCNRLQQSRNRRKIAGRSSIYKGVSLHKPSGKWRARVMANGETHYLGCFDTAEDAATAYDDAATKLHGQFASTNLWLANVRGAFAEGKS